jgi:hypothetical protein
MAFSERYARPEEATQRTTAVKGESQDSGYATAFTTASTAAFVVILACAVYILASIWI